MKKTVIALFLIIFSLSFSMTKEQIEKAIKRDRLETIENVRNLSLEKQNQVMVYTTLFTSDAVLEEMSKYNEPFNATKLVLIFPKIESMKKYLPRVASLVKYVDVYILDGEINEDYLQDRDYEDYVKEDLTGLLSKYFNITVIKLEVEEKDLPLLVEDSFKGNLRDGKSVLNKYFFNRDIIN